MNVCLMVLGILLGCPAATPELAGADRPGTLAFQTGGVGAHSFLTAPIVRDAPAVDASLTQPLTDPWLGEDKLRHFGLSFAAGSFSYGAGRVLLDADAALWISAAAAVAAGVGKEWLDVRRGRPWSWKDLAWDAAGAAAALLISNNSR